MYSRRRGLSPSRFLIPLSYASILGSTTTVIGTSTTLTIAGLMSKFELEEMGFFELAWVGIPIAIAGAGAILFAADQTLNVLSTFSFLMAIGIIVDDAIVVGENVFAHRKMDKSLIQAAIDGTCEVLPSVTTSVTTTIIAFSPWELTRIT